MDSNSFFKRLPSFLVLVGLATLAVLLMMPTSGPVLTQKGRAIASAVVHYGPVAEVIHEYSELWNRVDQKVKVIHRVDEENQHLRLDNMKLKVDLEATRFQCTADRGNQNTSSLEKTLKGETGAKVGRALASIPFKVPPRLLPNQLFTLGATYLKGREEEKSAVIFTHLTTLEESDSFRTARDLLAAGVSWYQVENYHLAENFFDEVLKAPDVPENLPFQAQARLWKALVAKKFNKSVKTQYWLKELIDHHPHAIEASWVNHAGEKGGPRAPAEAHTSHH